MVSELRLEARLFDLRHGTRTGGRTPAQELGLPDSGRAYQAVNERHFNAALRRTPVTGGAFVDFGAGKGKSLMLASRFPFARIVGVEYSQALCQIARSNVASWQRRTGCAAPVQVLQGDAANYDFQHDESTVFLYNPFGADVLQKVMAHLAHSLTVRPRAVSVLYHNPQHEAVLRDVPDLQPTDRVRSWVPGRDTAIYRALLDCTA